jgi:site-specific DNA recombinase
MSLRAIAFHFNESGIRPPKKRKNTANHWNPSRIRRILKNELYAGVYHWGKTRRVRKGYEQIGTSVKQPQENWISITIPELAIVDRDAFDLAQVRIERNKRLSKRNRKNNYLMTGFLRCGNCGCAVVGHAITKKRRKHFLFYRCGSQFKTYKAKVCTAINKRTIAYKIDNAVWEWLKSILLDKNALEMGLNKLTKDRSQLTEFKTRRLEIVHKLIDDTEKSIQRLVTEMANHGNNIVINAFRNEINIATKRLNAVIEERDRLEDELKQIEFSDDQRKCILAFAEKIQDRVNDASYNNKRHLLDVLDVQAVLYYENERKWLEITCAIPSNKSVIELHPSATPVPEFQRSPASYGPQP